MFLSLYIGWLVPVLVDMPASEPNPWAIVFILVLVIGVYIWERYFDK